MSKATKRKIVQKELLSQDYRVPDDVNLIVKITHNQGNNLHLVETCTGNSYFVSMPNKFRNNIWIKPGDYVVVKTIEEGNKVKGEIEQILDKKYIQFLKQQNSWPFKEESADMCTKKIQDNEEDVLEENVNRRNNVVAFSDSSSDESD